MEATYRTKAVILDRQPSSEHDSRVLAYSWERGKLELTARGTAKINSKLAGHLEPFNLVELMVVVGRGGDYAGATSSLSVSPSIKSDWHKLQAGVYFLSFYKNLLKPGESDKKIFLLLAQYIYWLNAIKASNLYYQSISRLAAWRFLCLLGLAGEAVLDKSCPAEARQVLHIFGEDDLASALRNFRAKTQSARCLVDYLDKLLPRITE